MSARPHVAGAVLAAAARLALAVALAASPSRLVRAQDYAFEVPSVLLETWIEPDGTLTLDYTFDIRNAPGAKALDGVDVGMPSTQWSVSRVRAWIDGKPAASIETSPYVRNAVAANLPGGGLPPGASATVRVVAEGVGGLLFADTTAPDRVSMRLTPTWFGAQFVRGASFVRVVFHLPPGVPADSLTWHAVPWVGQATVEATAERPEHAAVVYEDTYPFTRAWMLGISFPWHVTDAAGNRVAVVQGVATVTTWDLFAAWAKRPDVRGKATFAFLLAFSIVFFWATRRTGCVLWGAGCVVLFVLFAAAPTTPWLLAPLLPVSALLVRSARIRTRKRYVPAVASVEGGGIKRGLTAPEAACLLEAPPEKILLLVLYGLSRKGFVALQAEGEKGMKATASPGFGVTPAEDLRLAAEKGQVLHPYESAFLQALTGSVPKDVTALDWRKPLREVTAHAASRLQGFDLEQTKAYYRQIVARAWKEAATVGDLELRQQAVDRTFDWLVLDDRAWRRMDHWHRAGWRYRNPWIPAATGGGAAAPSAGGPPPLPGAPKASDVAGSVGGRLEGISSSFASALGLGSSPRGVFAGVDKVSGEAFKAFVTEMQKSSSGGGGRGGGSSCACACAGCACACACAGGGR